MGDAALKFDPYDERFGSQFEPPSVSSGTAQLSYAASGRSAGLLPAAGGPGVFGGQGPRSRQELRQGARCHPGFFERLRDLPPKEQERVLRNNKRFQQLSPERQQRTRENLRRWDRLLLRQKAQLRRRERIFSSLSPVGRQHMQDMAREWHPEACSP